MAVVIVKRGDERLHGGRANVSTPSPRAFRSPVDCAGLTPIRLPTELIQRLYGSLAHIAAPVFECGSERGDGRRANLLRADYVLRALCVPAGEHRVVLVYDPPLLKLGLAITGLTLLSIVGIALQASQRSGNTM